jgi:uncharacterized protein (DUF1501 family)
MKTSRRQFLVGCSSAIAAMAGSRIGFLGLADAQAVSDNRETLVIVFLRGGMDGLSLVPPIDGADRGHYEEARPNLKIPLSGAGAALPLDAQFGLHPSAAALLPLFQSKKLAIVHAVGSSGSRSHFDAMKYLELGTPGVKTTPTGWLTRHLQSAPNLAGTIPIPALAAGNTPPTSLQGSPETVNMVDSDTFRLGAIGHPSWAGGNQWASLRRICQLGDTFIHTAALQALDAAGVIESYVRSNYIPSGGVTYANSRLAQHMKLIAQLVKNDVGLRVATVDLGGWDTHENQGITPGGNFSDLVQELSDGLAALYADLDTSAADAPVNRLTVAVVSEFGRRIRENANRGTDHGTANPVLIMGGNVRGGFHGAWPGLHPDVRYDNADLAPTSDLRDLLAEVLIRRAGNPRLGEVFPAYTEYAPLNVVAGPELTPDFSVSIPVTPSDFAATRLAPTLIRLTWGTAPFATNFRIERRNDPGGRWEHLVVVSAQATRHDDPTVLAGALSTYRLQAFNSHGAGSFVEAAAPPVSEPRAQWRMVHFGTTANSGAAADDAVTTSDGLPNFVKYALGLDPHFPVQADTSGFMPGRPRTLTESGMLSLVYVRPVDRADVRYEVLTSTDLKTWSLVSETSEGTADGMERRRASVPVSNPGSQFLKLTVRPI